MPDCEVPMAEQGAKLQSVNNELVTTLESLRSKKSVIYADLQRYTQTKLKLKSEMARLSSELNRVDKILHDRRAAHEKYERLLANAEQAFDKLVQSSETLLQVVRSGDLEQECENST